MKKTKKTFWDQRFQKTSKKTKQKQKRTCKADNKLARPLFINLKSTYSEIYFSDVFLKNVFLKTILCKSHQNSHARGGQLLQKLRLKTFVCYDIIRDGEI